jgi:hypothetical protein
LAVPVEADRGARASDEHRPEKSDCFSRKSFLSRARRQRSLHRSSVVAPVVAPPPRSFCHRRFTCHSSFTYYNSRDLLNTQTSLTALAKAPPHSLSRNEHPRRRRHLSSNMQSSLSQSRPACTHSALARGRRHLVTRPAVVVGLLAIDRRRSRAQTTTTAAAAAAERRQRRRVLATAGGGGSAASASPGRPADPGPNDLNAATATAGGNDGGSSSSGGGKNDGGGNGGNGGGSDDDDGSESESENNPPPVERPRWYAAWIWATALAYLAWRFEWRRRRREAAAQAEAEQARHAEAVRAWDAFRWARSPPPARAPAAAAPGGEA